MDLQEKHYLCESCSLCEVHEVYSFFSFCLFFAFTNLKKICRLFYSPISDTLFGTVSYFVLSNFIVIYHIP